MHDNIAFLSYFLCLISSILSPSSPLLPCPALSCSVLPFPSLPFPSLLFSYSSLYICNSCILWLNKDYHRLWRLFSSNLFSLLLFYKSISLFSVIFSPPFLFCSSILFYSLSYLVLSSLPSFFRPSLFSSFLFSSLHFSFFTLYFYCLVSPFTYLFCILYLQFASFILHFVTFLFLGNGHWSSLGKNYEVGSKYHKSSHSMARNCSPSHLFAWLLLIGEANQPPVTPRPSPLPPPSSLPPPPYPPPLSNITCWVFYTSFKCENQLTNFMEGDFGD